jgi:DeoR family transcriptional regulator of aga operon
MKRYARLNALLDVMATDGHVDVEQLAEQLNVSASTVRRDLNHLTEQQLVTRTRGGAVASSISYDLPLRYRSAKRQPEKARIGEAAARFVRGGDVVGLNGGTTSTEVARAIATSRPADATDQITIVTNAINIAGELTVRRQLRLVMTGGVARPQSFELIGPYAGDTLQQLDLDIAVIGVDAIDPTAGAKALDPDEAQVSKLLIARSRRVILVADSTKLQARAFARICGWSEVHVLITDAEADADAVDTIRAAGVEVVTV